MRRSYFTMEHLKKKAKELKTELYALYLAYKMKETPILAKVVSAVVVAYALSPIDLIPDFIPVLGYLDDLLLIPLGIRLAIKLIPPNIMEKSRQEAKSGILHGTKEARIASLVIICIWSLIIALILLKLYQR